MENPLKKEDHTGLVVLLSLGAIAAGAMAYLYLTESGTDTRETLKHRVKDKAKDLASELISGKTGISKQAVKKVAELIFG